MIDPIDTDRLDIWEKEAKRCAGHLRLAKCCIKQVMPGSDLNYPDIERPVAHIITQINDLQFSIETILGNIQYKKQYIKEAEQ